MKITAKVKVGIPDNYVEKLENELDKKEIELESPSERILENVNDKGHISSSENKVKASSLMHIFHV